MAYATTSASAAGGAGVGELRSRWGWFVALGVLMIVAGVIALGSLLMATVVTALWVGVMMIVSGAFEIVHGFQMKQWGRFFLWIAIGALYVVAGFLVFRNPLLAAGVFTWLLGFGLIVAGVVRIFLAMQMKSGSAWGWVVLSGIITLLLGVVILLQWPASSAYALGIFLGVDLLFDGAAWLGMGLALRRAA